MSYICPIRRFLAISFYRAIALKYQDTVRSIDVMSRIDNDSGDCVFVAFFEKYLFFTIVFLMDLLP